MSEEENMTNVQKVLKAVGETGHMAPADLASDMGLTVEEVEAAIGDVVEATVTRLADHA